VGAIYEPQFSCLTETQFSSGKWNPSVIIIIQYYCRKLLNIIKRTSVSLAFTELWQNVCTCLIIVGGLLVTQFLITSNTVFHKVV